MRFIEERLALAALFGLALLASACGTAAAVDSDGGQDGGPAAGICEADVPDCVDPVDPDSPVDAPGATDGFGDTWDDAAIDDANAQAESLLGADESSLEADVRVGRRGDEVMALTEDYVLGRLTVELDPDDDGVQRVVSVTVELPDGPVTHHE